MPVVLSKSAMSNPVKIEKEQLPFISFRTSEKEQSHAELMKKLERATLLGNNFQTKVRIVFNTSAGLREVTTTVWAQTEQFIMLKQGNFIPVDAIVSVDDL